MKFFSLKQRDGFIIIVLWSNYQKQFIILWYFWYFTFNINSTVRELSNEPFRAFMILKKSRNLINESFYKSSTIIYIWSHPITSYCFVSIRTYMHTTRNKFVIKVGGCCSISTEALIHRKYLSNWVARDQSVGCCKQNLKTYKRAS
jgi:hypothetical protein